MSEKKFTLPQLVIAANTELNQIQANNTDARYSTNISERRVRDYITKNLLDKPFNIGKDKWFGEQHLEKLLTIRKLQNDGLSEQYIKKMTSNDLKVDQNTNLQKNALDFLGAMNSSEKFEKDKINPIDEIKKSMNINAISTLKKQVSRNWNEYQLDDDGKVFLRLDSNTSIKNKKEIIEKINNILNLKGE